MLYFFPPDVLDEILNLIESVSECFLTYSFNLLGVVVGVGVGGWGEETAEYDIMIQLIPVSFHWSPWSHIMAIFLVLYFNRIVFLLPPHHQLPAPMLPSILAE